MNLLEVFVNMRKECLYYIYIHIYNCDNDIRIRKEEYFLCVS